MITQVRRAVFVIGVLCFLITAPTLHAQVSSNQDCLKTLTILFAEEDWLENLMDPVITTADDLWQRRLFYQDVSDCLSQMEIESVLPEEVEAIQILIEYFLIFAGNFATPSQDTFAIDLATFDDPALVALQTAGLPAPEGYVFVRFYYSREAMPELIRSSFTDESVRAVTLLTRYIAVLAEQPVSREERDLQERTLPATISHELVHAYVNSRLGIANLDKLPDWFHEGVAIHFSGSGEYHAIVTPDGSNVRAYATKEYLDYEINFRYLESRLETEEFNVAFREAVEQASIDPLLNAAGVKDYETLYSQAQTWHRNRTIIRGSILIILIPLVAYLLKRFLVGVPEELPTYIPPKQQSEESGPPPTTSYTAPSPVPEFPPPSPTPSIPKAQFGSRVKAHYTIRLEDETVIVTTRNAEPLQFTIGDRRVWFGQYLIGLYEGQSRTIQIPEYATLGVDAEWAGRALMVDLSLVEIA